MDYADIRRLVKLIESSGISEIEIEEGETKVRIQKYPSGGASVQMPPMMAASYAYPPPQMPQVTAPVSTASAPVAAPVAPAAKTVDVLSPMVGTYYKAPSPDAPAYVQIGDIVKSGQVLCIVEAMKLMNEIESDVSGRIVEIAIQNAQPVEFGQLLFRIEPA